MGVGIAIHRNFFPLPLGITTGLNAIGFFSIGHLMRVWLKDISALDNWAWYYKVSIIAVWAALGWFIRCGMASCEVRYFPLDYVTGITGTIICYYLSRQIAESAPRIGKLLAIFGQYTISILLIHQLIADYGWIVKMDYTNNLLFISVTLLVSIVYIVMDYFYTKQNKIIHNTEA